jgi:hypothetical protein
MDHFESRIWNEFGCKYMDVSDRTKVHISTLVSLNFMIGLLRMVKDDALLS